MCFGNTSFEYTADNRKKWNLGQRITSRIDLGSFTDINLLELSAQIYRQENSNISEHPHIGTVYVYCAPCVRQIQTSMNICCGLGVSKLLNFAVRVDDRIPCSCCPAPLGLVGLTSLRDRLREKDISRFAGKEECFDRPWIEQRIFAIEEEIFDRQSEISASSNIERIFTECRTDLQSVCVGVVVLGEVIHCSSMLEAIPFPVQARKPRETDIYQVQCIYAAGSSQIQNWKRQYIGSYTPRKYSNVDPLAASPSPKRRKTLSIASEDSDERKVGIHPSQSNISRKRQNGSRFLHTYDAPKSSEV